MLVLSRTLGQKIFIGDNICVTVVDIDRGKVRIGVEAPRDVVILREEMRPKKPAPECEQPRRTRSQVLAAQSTVHGCCNRHADNQACDCLSRACGTS